jgi:nucleoside-diphosphate-sugar epimerase
MTTIAVTGATGFIGRQLIQHIEAAGHVALPLSRPLDPAVGWVIPPGADTLVHLAGRAHVIRESAADPVHAFYDSNVALTRNLANAASRAGVHRFVFISSAGVLGDASPPGGFNDDSPPRPYDAYSQSKWEAEELLRTMKPLGLETVIIRPPLVYGPGARGNFARLRRAVESGWPLPVGGLRSPRSMVGLRNLCDLIFTAALDARAADSTMLVADNETVSIAELVSMLCLLAGRQPRTFRVPGPVLASLLRLVGRGADVARLTHSLEVRPQRVLDLLGWRPPYSLAQELRWTMHQDSVKS